MRRTHRVLSFHVDDTILGYFFRSFFLTGSGNLADRWKIARVRDNSRTQRAVRRANPSRPSKLGGVKGAV